MSNFLIAVECDIRKIIMEFCTCFRIDRGRLTLNGQPGVDRLPRIGVAWTLITTDHTAGEIPARKCPALHNRLCRPEDAETGGTTPVLLAPSGNLLCNHVRRNRRERRSCQTKPPLFPTAFVVTMKSSSGEPPWIIPRPR